MADGLPLELAKDRLDVGFYTNDYDAMRAFYESDVALEYEELLKAGRGVHQHRFGVRGSVIKVNSAREALATDEPTAFVKLVIASESGQPRTLRDPDGTAVELVAPGSGGVDDLAVHWRVRDGARLGRLLRDGFGAAALADEAGCWRLGTTLLVVEEDPAAPAVETMFARGFRYLTVQVRDVRSAHARLLSAGWQEGRAPVRLGDVAYISFVRDAEGSWIEVSQRASLTGPLPDAD